MILECNTSIFINLDLEIQRSKTSPVLPANTFDNRFHLNSFTRQDLICWLNIADSITAKLFDFVYSLEFDPKYEHEYDFQYDLEYYLKHDPKYNFKNDLECDIEYGFDCNLKHDSEYDRKQKFSNKKVLLHKKLNIW